MTFARGLLYRRYTFHPILLEEFRTRLIADVVTGKLDVREAAARVPHETEDTGEAEEPIDDTPAEDAELAEEEEALA